MLREPRSLQKAAEYHYLSNVPSDMTNEKGRKTKKVKQATKTEGWLEHPEGHPRLSEWMGLKPETLIFRKFVALNARMLLYMQAELVELEEQLRSREKKDSNNAEGNHMRYATNFWYLRLSHKDGDTTQLELIRKIQDKLKEYSEYQIRERSRRYRSSVS
jgi:hypothetical protein